MTSNPPSDSPTYFAPVYVSATMGPASRLGEDGQSSGFGQGAMISVSPVGGPERS